MSLDNVLAEALERACQAQNERNIVSGREDILALPRDGVLAHVEAVAEPLLQLDDEWEWRRLLELYKMLDAGLTQRLVRRALSHPDPEIREAGQEFLRQ